MYRTITIDDNRVETVRQEVEWLQGLGFHVIPLDPKKKHGEGKGKGYRSKSYIPDDFKYNDNVGFMTGKVSGNTLDIEIDVPREAGYDRIAALADEMLPETGMQFGRKSKPGSHRVYRTAEATVEDRTAYKDPESKRNIFEVRGNDQHSMCPPSIRGGDREKGEQIEDDEYVEWTKRGEPTTYPEAELLQAAGRFAAASMLVLEWEGWSGSHHDIALHLSGALAWEGWEEDEARRFVELVCRYGGDDGQEIRDDRMKTVTYSFEGYERGKKVGGIPKLAEIIGFARAEKLREWCRLDDGDDAMVADLLPATAGGEGDGSPRIINLTDDISNATRFTALMDGSLRYTQQKGWLRWNGRYWKEYADEQVQTLAEDVQQVVFREAKAALDGGNKKLAARLTTWGKQCGSADKIRKMVNLAKGRDGIFTDFEIFDQNPHLLNVANGVVDLRTGELLPHAKEFFITKMIDIPYLPEQECPTWDKFINRAMDSDGEMVEYIQRVCGYTLTGDTREQAFFFFYGEGSNGKSTVISTLSLILGPYHVKIPFSSVALGRAGKIRNDLAMLKGARMVSTGESVQGQALDEAMLKDMTGGDQIPARFLGKEFFSFWPTHKLFLYGNHYSTIRGTDPGFWRRNKAIPFGPPIPKEEQIDNFAQRLVKDEGPGILAWMVRGCVVWYRDGLMTPTKVIEETNQYREEMGKTARFIQEATEQGNELRALYSELRMAYVQWCKLQGIRALDEGEWQGELRLLGFPTLKSNSKVYRSGLSLNQVGKSLALGFNPLMDNEAPPWTAPASTDVHGQAENESVSRLKRVK